MLTTDQISQAIDAAETSLREKKYAEAYGTVGPLLVSLKRGEVPEGKFFVAILLQLSSLLGGLNDNEDDGGEQYKSAQRARAQLLRDLDTREAEGSSHGIVERRYLLRNSGRNKCYLGNVFPKSNTPYSSSTLRTHSKRNA